MLCELACRTRTRLPYGRDSCDSVCKHLMARIASLSTSDQVDATRGLVVSSLHALSTCPIGANPTRRHVLVASVGRRLVGVLAGLGRATAPGWAGAGSDPLTCRLFLGGWIDVNQRVWRALAGVFLPCRDPDLALTLNLPLIFSLDLA